METQDEMGIKYADMIAEITRYLNELKTPSSQSYQQYPTNYPLIGMDDLTNLVNGGYSQGIANGLATAGTTTTIQYSNPKKEKIHTLTRDGGYFIYWLMMHIAFLEDDGYNSTHPTIFSNITTWGRSVIYSGVYNELDRAFLEEVREYMNNRKWVYKKPSLNEHNDTLPLIERLPISATKIKV